MKHPTFSLWTFIDRNLLSLETESGLSLGLTPKWPTPPPPAQVSVVHWKITGSLWCILFRSRTPVLLEWTNNHSAHHQTRDVLNPVHSGLWSSRPLCLNSNICRRIFFSQQFDCQWVIGILIAISDKYVQTRPLWLLKLMKGKGSAGAGGTLFLTSDGETPSYVSLFQWNAFCIKCWWIKLREYFHWKIHNGFTKAGLCQRAALNRVQSFVFWILPRLRPARHDCSGCVALLLIFAHNPQSSPHTLHNFIDFF